MFESFSITENKNNELSVQHSKCPHGRQACFLGFQWPFLPTRARTRGVILGFFWFKMKKKKILHLQHPSSEVENRRARGHGRRWPSLHSLRSSRACLACSAFQEDAWRRASARRTKVGGAHSAKSRSGWWEQHSRGVLAKWEEIKMKGGRNLDSINDRFHHVRRFLNQLTILTQHPQQGAFCLSVLQEEEKKKQRRI